MVLALLASCSTSKAAPSGPVSLVAVGQKYSAAIGPVDKALSSFRELSLAYTGGLPNKLVSAIPPTRSALKLATKQLLAIGAPAPLGGDIKDVVAATGAVDADLVAIGAGGSAGVEGLIAKLIADIGRQSAADSTFRFTLQLLIDPASLPTPATVDETTVAPTTVKGRTTTTTTTRTPRTTSTTVGRTTTTARTP